MWDSIKCSHSGELGGMVYEQSCIECKTTEAESDMLQS